MENELNNQEIGFKKYPKIYAMDNEENELLLSIPEDDIIIEEKIDGANFRVFIKDGNLIFGTRTQEIGETPQSNNHKNFMRCIDFIKEKLKDKNLDLFDRKILYGESCHCHTINYDWDIMPPFLGFDIFCLDQNIFLNNKNELYKLLDIETVPIIKQCKSKDIIKIDDNDVPISKYALSSSKDQKAEGLVIKNYRN